MEEAVRSIEEIVLGRLLQLPGGGDHPLQVVEAGQLTGGIHELFRCKLDLQTLQFVV